MSTEKQKPLFRDLAADDPEPEVTEVESLCMNCSANGMTRLLLTRIPHYKNVIIMSFSCEECGYQNNEIQPGGAYSELGVRWKLRVLTKEDLDRQVVKSDHTTVRIPEVDLEIPAQSQKGEVTTVESVIQRTISGLNQDQASRREQDPEAADQIDIYVAKLTKLVAFESGSFTLELEDVTGNCYVENPFLPQADPNCVRTQFERTKDQDHALGIYTREEMSNVETGPDEPTPSGLLLPVNDEQHTLEAITGEEVLTFPTNCPECNAPAQTDMKLTNIPHFKEVVIMATTCESCGHRTNEVKSGGGIEAKGVKFVVRVAGREDFSRDVLKSETCAMEVPELELQAGPRILGGRFTTVEGLLRSTAEQLAEPAADDAAVPERRERMDRFLARLEEVLAGRMAVTVVLDDPAGNSYVQSLAEEPGALDDGLQISHYERSFDQNEELGINDMKTEGYEENKR